jgi:hypothetical protein
VILILKTPPLLEKNGNTCGQLRGFVKAKNNCYYTKKHYFKISNLRATKDCGMI